VENLAKAGKAGWGEGTAEAQAWLEQRKTELWNGQLVQVEIGLEELPRRYKERGTHICQVKSYVDQHWKRLRYDRFRAEGRSIGSGNGERSQERCDLAHEAGWSTVEPAKGYSNACCCRRGT
jgi:hypothetical protein